MLKLEGIEKRYDDGFTVRADLEVRRGETLALLGPSGSGKTTVLRLVAGLERPDAGRVLLAGREVTHLPPERRGLGFVFQDYALFPHLSVRDNLAFGLVERRWPRERIQARVAALLELVHLEPHAHKRPQHLSGGEQQRVALARALAPEPEVLLLDEPLGALDQRLREALLLELRRILRQSQVTAVVVTHDQTEAFALADRVAVMRAGRVVQQGTPEALYNQPKDTWTARFLGHKNVLEPREARAVGLEARPHVLLPGGVVLGRGDRRMRVTERLFLGGRVGLWLEDRAVRLYWEGTDPGALEGTEVRVQVVRERAVEVAP